MAHPIQDATLRTLKSAWQVDITTAKDLATVLGSAIPQGASKILFQAIAATCQWTSNGDTPSAAVGFTLAIGDYFYFSGDLPTIKFFAGAGGKLNVEVYGAG